jgi:hypothetical protein
MDRRLIPSVLIVLALATACAGETSSEGSATPSTPNASTPAPTSSGGSADLRAITAAACDEVNRLTRETMEGITDPSPDHWAAFAVSLQNVANGAPDPAMRDALTALATGALTASDQLGAGSNVRDSVADFDDAFPALDVLCKKAGQPLN